jgi:CheY-like chemotaxis protein
MDMNMPVMGGADATRHIRDELQLDHLPVIALTGNVLERDRIACAAAGTSDFLAKPVDASKLWNTLARWMPRHVG